VCINITSQSMWRLHDYIWCEEMCWECTVTSIGSPPIPASGFFTLQHMWMALSCSSACLKLFTVYYYFTVNKGHSTRALPNSIFGGAKWVLITNTWAEEEKTLSRDWLIFPKEHLLLTYFVKIHTLNHKSKTEPVFKYCLIKVYDPWKPL